MCCLFGMLDYKYNLTQKQQRRVVSMLAVAAEDRGTDATGIAYNSHDRLHIYKRPLPAHGMRFSLPSGITAVMGHTRMTTQGDEKRNYNNHPFPGLDSTFALAHNGVLYNDERLRKVEKLPDTRIETDSYIAVQLIEQSGVLSFDSLRSMAEKLEGSFTITVLDKNDNLYFIRGDNPMCIYHYPDAGVYVYASTEPILLDAISKFSFRLGKKEKVDLKCGDILMIDKHDRQTRMEFDTTNLMRCSYRYSFWHSIPTTPKVSLDREYIDDLKAVAGGLGYSPNYIDYLISGGYTGEEIEELMYYGGYSDRVHPYGILKNCANRVDLRLLGCVTRKGNPIGKGGIMKIGYIRISTMDQNTARQEVLMQELGVEQVFVDQMSGKNMNRPELKRMLNFVREGNTVIVESISRFARNTRDLLELVEHLSSNHVEFISKKEAIDTSTPTGKFMLTVFGAVAELEREYILQRQREGIDIAKANGAYKGRKPIVRSNFDEVVAKWRAGEMTAVEAMQKLDMKPSTFYRKVKGVR